MRQMTADFYFHVGNTSCWTCFSISQRARISVSPRTDAETSSAWRDDNKHEKRKRRDVCVQRPRFFTHANRANPAKGLEQNFARFVGFAWDYNSCVLFGRCTQRPYPLTPLLRRICYSLFLSIRVCDPKIENMSFCSSVEKLTVHNSSLSDFHKKC